MRVKAKIRQKRDSIGGKRELSAATHNCHGAALERFNKVLPKR
jgi:hypothetical protein